MIDLDYKHAKRVVQQNIISNTLMLADVFGKFINMYLKIYELNPAKKIHFLDCHDKQL